MRLVEGRVPPATPETVAAADTLTVVVVTPTTLAKIGSSDLERCCVISEANYFTFRFPGNNSLELLIVLIPLAAAVIEATPMFNDGVVQR